MITSVQFLFPGLMVKSDNQQTVYVDRRGRMSFISVILINQVSVHDTQIHSEKLQKSLTLTGGLLVRTTATMRQRTESK